MADTYCGKVCKQCEKMQNNECVGCKTENEGAKSEKCLVAQCCNELKHSSCWKCGTREGCTTYHSAITPKAKDITKCMKLLFITMIMSVIVSVLSLDMVLEKIPQLAIPGFIASVAVAGAYAGILLGMSSYSYSYRVASITAMIALVPTIVTYVVGAETAIGNIIKVIGLAVSMISWYNEIDGHASVLADVDNGLADKWRIVWNGILCARLAIICGVLAIFVSVNLAAYLILMGSIGVIVVEVFKFVYLYKTSKAFDKISGR